MTEELKTQVSGEPTPESGLPQPKFSEETPDSPTSALTSEQLKAISEALRPVIKEESERAAQSVKDKRFNQFEKRDDSVKELLATLKAANVPIPPGVEAQYQLRDMLDEELARRGVAPVPDKSISGAGASKTDNFNVVEELQKFGFTTNDPDVMKKVQDLGKGLYRNPDHFRADIAELAVTKLKPPTPSSLLNSPAKGGGGGSQQLDEAEREKLSGNLIDLMREPTKNAAQIEALQKRLAG
jgi:hypothetical protein